MRSPHGAIASTTLHRWSKRDKDGLRTHKLNQCLLYRVRFGDGFRFRQWTTQAVDQE